MQAIHEIIWHLRQEYAIQHGLREYAHINYGLCVEFAYDIQALLPDVQVISNDFFMDREDGDGWNNDEDDVWDEKELLVFGSPIPNGLTASALNTIIRGYHMWAYYRGKHYDAECPQGVSNLFDLPFFQRHLSDE